MNLPFFESPDREWKPRKRAGIDPNLSAVERETLDTLDVLEQQTAFTMTVACRGWNLLLVLAAIFILTNGPGALRVVQGWLGAKAPVALSK